MWDSETAKDQLFENNIWREPRGIQQCLRAHGYWKTIIARCLLEVNFASGQLALTQKKKAYESILQFASTVCSTQQLKIFNRYWCNNGAL